MVNVKIAVHNASVRFALHQTYHWPDRVADSNCDNHNNAARHIHRAMVIITKLHK